VYTPHIAPKVEAWREARRKYRPVPVRARSGPSDDDEDNVPLGRTPGMARKDSDDRSDMSVELQDLVARERAEWTRTDQQSTLRQRKVNTSTVLDEVCGSVITTTS
jgi:hypothetical protein